jgi:hypothetical protein
MRQNIWVLDIVTKNRFLFTFICIVLVLHTVFEILTWNWHFTFWRLVKSSFIKYMIKHDWFTMNTKDAENAIVLLHDILTANNITYWLSEGTALGVIRERRILPWDDDLDFGIFDSERSHIEELLPTFTNHGFYISDEQGLFFWKFMFKNIIIDIDMTGRGHYCHAASSPCDYILPVISNLTYVNLFGRDLPVPNTAYLDKLYTKKWHIPVKKYKPPCLGYTYNC